VHEASSLVTGSAVGESGVPGEGARQDPARFRSSRKSDWRERAEGTWHHAGSASSGLAVPPAATLSTCVWIIVLLTSDIGAERAPGVGCLRLPQRVS
jgi:hypothetical protein